ncbi:hypothetical protein HY382_01840 [Candidatus Curtissbacteria bacterium]|nr:hypothetical protein [Candidatus Curtissbacteria bacterium]
MITVLHGEDVASSDKRLKIILKNYSQRTKLWFQQKSDSINLIEQINQSTLFGGENVYICQNYLSQKFLTPKQLTGINHETVIIFWEQKSLKKTDILKLPKDAKIELFKEKQIIFLFLDSISPNLTKTLTFLGKTGDEDNVVWNLTQRFLIMLLLKLEFSKSQIENFTQKKLQDWQLDKISYQASLFNKETLSGIFFGILKIDFLMKSGKTDLPAKNLIEMLFIKHLRSS